MPTDPYAYDPTLIGMDEVPTISAPQQVTVRQVGSMTVEASWPQQDDCIQFRAALLDASNNPILDNTGVAVYCDVLSTFARLTVPYAGDQKRTVKVKVTPMHSNGTLYTGTTSAALDCYTQFRTDDIASGAVFDTKISPGTINAPQLAQKVEVGGSFSELSTPDDGRNRVILSGTGLVLRQTATNTNLVSLPTATNARPSFTGRVTADSLISAGSTLSGTTSIESNSTITLSAGITPAPVVAPDVFEYYPTTYTFPTTSSFLAPWNLWVDSAGGPSSDKKTAWMAMAFGANSAIEFDMSTPGSLTALRTLNLAGETHAVCRAGGQAGVTSRIYALFWNKTDMVVNAYSTSTLTQTKSQVVSVNGYEPTILPDTGRDNTLLVIDSNVASGTVTALRVRSYTLASDGTMTLAGTATRTVSGFADVATMSLWATMNGTSLYIGVADTVKERVLKFTISRSSGVISSLAVGTGADADWATLWGSAGWGGAWDSTLNGGSGGFWLHNGFYDYLYGSSGSTDTGTYLIAYNYRGTGSPVPMTTLSPSSGITRSVYADLSIGQWIVYDVSGVAGYGYYAKKTSATAWSTFRLQATSANTYVNLSSLSVSGDTAPTISTFGATAAAGAIVAGNGFWRLNGDGTSIGLPGPRRANQAATATVITSGTNATGSVPTDATYIKEMLLVGGGQGGNSSTGSQAGTGGSGGAVVVGRWIPVLGGDTYTYSIGAGGAGASAGSSGATSGGNTTMRVSGYTFTAYGGGQSNSSGLTLNASGSYALPDTNVLLPSGNNGSNSNDTVGTLGAYADHAQASPSTSPSTTGPDERITVTLSSFATANTNEVQTVTMGSFSSGDSYTLRWVDPDGVTKNVSTAITYANHNANESTAGSVRYALAELLGSGNYATNLSSSGSPTSSQAYTVTFQGIWAGRNMNLMTSPAATGCTCTPSKTTSGAGSAYRFAYNSSNSPWVIYSNHNSTNTTAGSVRYALDAMFGSGNWTTNLATTGTPPASYTVTAAGTLANTDLSPVTIASTVSATVSVAETIKGGVISGSAASGGAAGYGGRGGTGGTISGTATPDAASVGYGGGGGAGGVAAIKANGNGGTGGAGTANTGGGGGGGGRCVDSTGANQNTGAGGSGGSGVLCIVWA